MGAPLLGTLCLLHGINNSLCHGSNLASFRNTPSMRNVRLDDIDTACLKVRPHVLARKEAFTKLVSALESNCTHGNRDSCLIVQILHLVDESGEERLFDEERSMGFEVLSELFGHSLVYAAVKVETGIQA